MVFNWCAMKWGLVVKATLGRRHLKKGPPTGVRFVILRHLNRGIINFC